MTTTERILLWICRFCGMLLVSIGILYGVMCGIDWEMERREEMQRPPIERHRGYTQSR